MAETSKNPVTSVRLPEMTRRQLEALTNRHAMSMANVLTIAIDRMYQQEITPMTSQIDQTTISAILRAEITPEFASDADKVLRQQYIVDRRGTFRGTNLVIFEMSACPNTPAIYEWHDGSVTVFDIRPRTQQTNEELARVRVRTTELNADRDILVDYDWPNMDEHWQWLATADMDEIRAWIRMVREAENAIR